MSEEKVCTISDIAKAAKVSNATVSRVLNHSEYPVREELKQRVLRAAKEMDYKPNIFSRMLKGCSSTEVGVIVPTITNPFYARLVSAVEKECIDRGFIPIICSSYNSPQLERNHIDMLQTKQVAGLIISTINTGSSYIKKLEDGKTPFVMFDQSLEGFHGDCVTFDFYKGAYMATEYLILQGHRKIAFACAPIDRRSRKLVYEGYKQALKDYQLRPSNKRTLFCADSMEDSSGEYDYQNGEKLAEMILGLTDLPEAVFAINDMTAIGIINALAKHGIQVPSDISVIGFDNISLSAMVTPALTTIDQPAYQTGYLAAHILLDKIQGLEAKVNQIMIEPNLIERSSVRKKYSKIRG